jgi:hypothetical protein
MLLAVSLTVIAVCLSSIELAVTVTVEFSRFLSSIASALILTVVSSLLFSSMPSALKISLRVRSRTGFWTSSVTPLCLNCSRSS